MQGDTQGAEPDLAPGQANARHEWESMLAKETSGRSPEQLSVRLDHTAARDAKLDSVGAGPAPILAKVLYCRDEPAIASLAQRTLGSWPYVRGTHAGWDIVHRERVPDGTLPPSLASAAQESIALGAAHCWLDLTSLPSAEGFIRDLESIATNLDAAGPVGERRKHSRLRPLVVSAPCIPLGWQVTAQPANMTLLIDPLRNALQSALATSRSATTHPQATASVSLLDVAGLRDQLRAVVGDLVRQVEHGPSELDAGLASGICLSAVPWSEAGATHIDQIAVTLAGALEYLRAAQAQGVAFDALCAAFCFEVSTGRDVFLELSKLRALRRCWAELLVAIQAPATTPPPPVHATGAWRERSRRDPWVNQLRATTELLAAVFGGADLISLEAADGAEETRGATGLRLGINAQLIAKYESALGNVADPGGGSGYVESLTLQLSQGAWARLQLIERRGGLIAALAEGSLVHELRADGLAEIAQVHALERPLLGLTHFPAAREFPFPGVAPQPTDSSHSFDATEDAARVRLGLHIENLRSRAQACTQRGAPPLLLLAETVPPGQKPNDAGRLAQGCRACGVNLEVVEAGTTSADGAALAPRRESDPLPIVAKAKIGVPAWALKLETSAAALRRIDMVALCEPAIASAELHLRSREIDNDRQEEATP